MTLYKLNRAIQEYPILRYIIDHVETIQQGQGERTTIVNVVYKQFCD